MMRMVWLLGSLAFVVATSQAKTDALSDRQVGIVTIAAFTANGDLPKLKVALNEALDAGLTINEIKEVLVQMYAYAGFPRSLNGINTFNEVLKQRRQQGKKDSVGPAPNPLPTDKSRQELGGEIRTRLTGSTAVAEYAQFVPIIDEFLRAHLFGDIFGRDNLDFQSREIATIAALASLEGVNPQLKAHFNVGLNVGLTSAQLTGIVAAIETRVGKLQGENASSVLDETLRDRSAPQVPANMNASNDARASQAIRITQTSEVSLQPAADQHFTGSAQVQRLFEASAPARASVGSVSFERGARTAWHTHPLGQTLIVSTGVGYVQQWGSVRQEMRAGDVVRIPPGTKHWHGASHTTGMTHIAITEVLDEQAVEWMEKVSDEQYGPE
jgi:4-carboxymuconolactone decarboxylase